MANQRFNIQFDFQANMAPIQSSIADLQKKLSGITLPPNLATSFEKLFGKLETEMSQFEALTKNGFGNMVDVNKAQAAFSRISKLMNQIGIEAGRVKGLDPNKLIPKEAQSRVDGLKKKLGELQAQQAKKDSYAESIKKQNELINKQQRALSDLETKRKALDADAKSLSGQKGAATKRRNEAQSSLNEAIVRRDSLIASGVKANDPALSAAKKDIDTYAKAVRDAQAQIDTLSNKLNTNATQMRNNAANTEIAERELKDLQAKLTEMRNFQINPQGLLELRQELAKIQGVNLDEVPQDLEQIQILINSLNAEHLSQVTQKVQQMDASLEEIDSSADRARDSLNGMANTAQSMNRAAQDVENLKNQVLQFFSLTNSVQLFKRAVTSALNTVKELDATMTEAAVVTDFSVGDMWNKLPRYSAEAQKLGVSINGMYKATTLYYQQGLKTNEAMELGIETMKMAKIAGMESAEATEAMTAALRGFNMELNEISAVRVNDVYSQLAAVTAADTEQIATAMSKTASIAANANMEFETTAALLAQIIETTQEAPETAGTAMKTIIARFSEVKELKDQGLTTGQDSEGEAIDVNKIQTALRSVGISMTGFFEGTEGLDSIFLKLAEKWNTLDFTTQRYIATMAAGSRQQSRFIAMMSDYGRTTELVSEANNSAGASQRQFNKTLDSMDSKLQKLENAWDEFLMGLANNEILKGGIDLLTGIIEGINKATEALSGGNGLIKSVTSLAVAFAGIKMAKGLFTNMFGKMGAMSGSLIGPDGQEMKLTMQRETGVQKSPSSSQRFQQSREAGKGFLASTGSFLWDKEKGEEHKKAAIEKVQAKRRAQAERKMLKKQKSAYKRGKNDKSYTSQQRGADEYKNELDVKVKGLDKDQMNQVKQAYDDAIKSGKSFTEATKIANDEVTKLGGTFGNVGTKVGNFAKGIGGIDLKGLANGAMAAGGALLMLSSVFSMMGWEEGADAVQKIGVALMGVSAVLTIIPGLLKVIEVVGVSAGATVQAAFGWISLVAAAIVLIIALVASFVKKGKSVEEKLQDVNTQIDQMKEASKEAAEALERITDTRQELYNMQDAFKGLVKGTDEWRKVLVESNSKVLELLDAYPELVDYITTDADGMMSISSEGWAKITEKQQQAIVSTQASAAALQARKTKLQRQQIEEDKNLSDTEKKAKLTALDVQSKTQQQAYYTAAIASDRALANSKYAQNAANVLSYESQADVAKEITKEETKWANKDGFNDDQKEKLREEYSALTGKSLKEVSDIIEAGDITYEDMNAAIAADKVTKKKAEQMKNITRAMSKASKEDQAILEKMFTKDAKGLRKKDLNSIKKSLGLDENTKITKAELDNYLVESFNIELDDDQLIGLTKALNNASEAFSDTGEIIKEINSWGLGGEDNQIIKDFVTGTEYGTGYEFAKKFGGLIEKGRNADDIKQLIEQIENLANNANMTTEQRDNLLNQLANTNWESKEDIVRTVDVLKDIKGIDIEGIENLGRSIDELASATSENTVAQLKNKNWNLKDMIEQVLSGEMDERNLTTEQVEALKKAGAASSTDFVQLDNDSYMYTGDLYSKVVNLYTDNVNNQKEKVEATEDNLFKAKLLATSIYGERLNQVNTYQWGTTRTKTDDELKNDSSLNVWYSQYEEAKKAGSFSGDYATYLKNYHSSTIAEKDLYTTTGLSESQRIAQEGDVRVWYNDMAQLLGVTAQKDLTPEEMVAKMNEWAEIFDYEKLYSDFIEHTNSMVGNTQMTTAQIGYANLEDSSQAKEYAKKYSEAIDNRLKATGGSVFLDDISKGLTSAEKAGKKFDTSIKAVASDMASVAGKTRTLAENMSNLADDLGKNKNTPEYGKALNKAKSNVANYFGVDEKDLEGISDEFYKRLADGDPQALQEIQNKIAETLLNGYMIGSQEFQNSDFANMVAFFQVDPILDEAGMAKFKEDFGIDLAKLTDEAQRNLEKAMSLKGVQIGFERDEQGNIIGVTTSQLQRTNWYSNYSKGSGSDNKYENSYDKLHNTLEEINDLLRERERLERRYQRLIDRNNATAAELAKIRQLTVDTYQLEIIKQEEVRKGRIQQIEQELAKNKKLQKYVYVENDPYNPADKTLRINWDALNALKNADTGEKVDQYYDNIDGWLDSIYEVEGAIAEAQDAIYEQMTQGKDEFLDLEEQVKEAIINSRQKEIDELSNINDSINDANSKLLDSMQQQIDEYRQNRENEKTEEELSDKQRKLSYLQQDTSGANALEIMQLQKEIDEGQESYTDQLIDQKISELQKQNDQAAEQRQHQIDLMQAQLDQYSESDKIYQEVAELMKTGLDSKNGLVTGQRLEELLKDSANFKGMSEIGRMEWLRGLETTIAQGLAWREGQGVLSTYWTDKQISFTTADGKTVNGTVNADGTVTGEDGNVYDKVNWEGGNVFTTTENAYQEPEVEPEETEKISKDALSRGVANSIWYGYNGGGWGNGSTRTKKLAEVIGEDNSVQSYVNKIANGKRVPYEGSLADYYYSALKDRDFVAYKTGGLADFTGPAWLDGTKSRPEYILNADQTKAFFNLVDVLGSLQTGKTEPAQNSGDNTYDIDINVESIGSDYDVEQLASVVKRLIVDDANYRNNNAINLMR